MEQHKKDLAELADVDPEFYKFLKKEDAGLLDFDMNGDNDDDEVIPDDDPEQMTHQLPDKLEEMEASDDENQVCLSSRIISFAREDDRLS